jgi:hypothetical protein
MLGTDLIEKPLPIGLALAAVMRRVDAIGKDGRNQAQGFRFRGIDQVYNTLHTLLAEVGVVCLPQVVSCEREQFTTGKGSVMFRSVTTMRYVFVASDGSREECQVVGEGMDSGDKATAKSLAACHKYCLLQMFLVPTRDMADGDADSPEPFPAPAPVAIPKPLALPAKGFPPPPLNTNA